MKKYTLSAIILFSLLKYCLLQIIAIPLELSFRSLAIEVALGNEKSGTDLFQLSFDTPYIWVSDPSLLNDDGDTFFMGNETLEVNGRELEGKIFETKISIPNTEVFIERFPLYLFENNGFSFQYNSFPLSPAVDNENFSFIHHLYKTKTIQKKAFGINFSYEEGGQLYLGGIDEKVKENFPYQVKVFSEKNRLKWNAKMQEVRLGKEVYKINDLVYFQGSHDAIYAPESFIGFLNRTFFQEPVEKEICSYFVGVKEDWERFTCKTNYIQKFDLALEFVMDNKIFKMSKTQLFHVQRYFSHFKIELNVANRNAWSFGTPFLATFPSLFDYDENSITFFTKSDFRLEPLTNKNLKKFFFITIITLIFGCTGIIIQKLRKN